MSAPGYMFLNNNRFLCLVDYRQVDDDQGPAFHLLAEVESMEPHTSSRWTTIWRVDCFERKPHEHRFTPAGETRAGLEAQGVATTIVWCIQQLRDLARLIDEIGYPDLAADVDQDSITPVCATLQKWLLEAKPETS